MLHGGFRGNGPGKAKYIDNQDETATSGGAILVNNMCHITVKLYDAIA